MKREARKARPRPPVVLCFGEDENDRDAVRELVSALRPTGPRVEPRRQPLILVRGEDQARDRKNAAAVAAVVQADQVDHDVRGVIAHKDCDAVEPAHVQLAESIEGALTAAGVPEPVAATPAWELEAWLFLWPDAVVAAFPSWRRPDDHTGKSVGRLRDAKEAFRRAVRQRARKGEKATGGKDYHESDAPRIARKVRELGLIEDPQARSSSFARFRDKVLTARW